MIYGGTGGEGCREEMMLIHGAEFRLSKQLWPFSVSIIRLLLIRCIGNILEIWDESKVFENVSSTNFEMKFLFFFFFIDLVSHRRG